MNIHFGPFSAHEADWLTERTLDSEATYLAFEHLYRGDISIKEFLSRLEFQCESLHSDFIAEQKSS